MHYLYSLLLPVEGLTINLKYCNRPTWKEEYLHFFPIYYYYLYNLYIIYFCQNDKITVEYSPMSDHRLTPPCAIFPQVLPRLSAGPALLHGRAVPRLHHLLLDQGHQPGLQSGHLLWQGGSLQEDFS